MSKAILILDMPDNCFDCFFRSNSTDVYLGDGLYKKISKCLLAEDVEDPWRNTYWQMNHKEDWCPLKSVPEEYEACGKFTCENMWGADEQLAFMHGWNDCLKEILGE